MDWATWDPHYRGILREFGYDPAKDDEAARALAGLLAGRESPAPLLASLLKGHPATVVGAGPAVEEAVAEGLTGVVLAADKAVPFLLARGRVPEVVVTDLDGPEDALVRASRLGSVLAVHAHGDNVEALKRTVPRLPGRLLGTCQCRPPPGLSNFGGFTDGDRACFLAAHFGASRLTLVGFDFREAGPGTRDPALKRKKLAWAERLVGELAKSVPIRWV